MNTTDKITRIERQIRDLKRKVTPVSEVWIPEKQAAEILGLSLDATRRLRRSGRLTGWRVRPSGRGYQYRKSHIESYLITA